MTSSQTSSRIPTLLEPYITASRPQGSLILLTSVLGASANWLTLLWLKSAVGDATRSPENADSKPHPKIGGEVKGKVVLVSFLRDYDFWYQGSRRLVCEFPSLVGDSRIWRHWRIEWDITIITWMLTYVLQWLGA
jgi:elongator complex protein 6